MLYADEILRLSFEFEKLAARRMPLSEAYAILGVSPTMDESEIKKIYKRLAIQNHPDRQPDDQKEAANIKMVQLNLAWEAIQHKDERDPFEDLWEQARKRREEREGNQQERERAYQERQQRREREYQERSRQEGLHVTFEEASIAANIPVNAEWMFMTSVLNVYVGSKERARAIIGMDAQNVYVVGLFHKDRDYYMNTPEQYRMSVKAISRRSQRGLEQRVRGAIKEVLQAVIGEANIKIKTVRVQQTSDTSWNKRYMRGGVGPKIGIRKALEAMEILRPKQPKQRQAPPPPPAPPSERPTPEEAPPRPDERYEPEAADAVPAKTDTINLSALFVKKQGETLPRWVANTWYKSYTWTRDKGKTEPELRRLGNTAKKKFKETWTTLLNEAPDELVTSINHPKYGSSRHLFLVNYIPDEKIYKLYQSAVFWNGVRESVKDILKNQ
jgi:curved DNA-binding protein CbpA